MLLADTDVRVDLVCGRYPDRRWGGWYRISIRAGVLRRLGLYRD